MAKPWAPSHVSEVAKGRGIEKRISGDVKKTLVEMLNLELKKITINMEKETIMNDSERKTLGDPERTRLSYSRTRGLMVDYIQKLDSVGSSAVVSANEYLEEYLLMILSYASDSADSDKMNTIMKRHLESAITILNEKETGSRNKNTEEELSNIPNLSQNIELSGSKMGQANLTKGNIKAIVRSIAGMKIEEDALEDLLLVYYDHAAHLQEEFQNIISKGSKVELEINMERSRTLMKLGWLRRMLKQAATTAHNDGSTKIMLKHVIRIDPWE
jgi:histone H3/H4